MKDKEIVKINGVEYEYCSHDDALFRPSHNGSVEHPVVACPKCHGMKFSITYGNYVCIANCECGHSMSIYDG